MSRMLGLEPWPSEDEIGARLAGNSPPKDANGLSSIAWPLINPDQPVYGEEVKGLLLERRALAVASAAEQSENLDSLAWADFRVGRLDDALAEELGVSS